MMTRKKKFAYVVSALHPEVAELITDTIVPPPASDRYSTIKARLPGEFTLTAAERVGQLLDLPVLGAQRPSELLSKMLQLLPGPKQANPGILFRTLFVEYYSSSNSYIHHEVLCCRPCLCCHG